MLTAYRTAMQRYATFEGRASRSEFWLFQLAVVLMVLVGLVIDIAIFANVAALTEPIPFFTILVSFAHALPALTATLRRLHDTDRSGWTMLLQLIPVAGPIILIVFLCGASTPGPNRFGPQPNTRSGATTAHAANRGAPQRQPDPARQRSGGDVAAELRQLVELKTQGHLTDPEFQQLKAGLMARYAPRPGTPRPQPSAT